MRSALSLMIVLSSVNAAEISAGLPPTRILPAGPPPPPPSDRNRTPKPDEIDTVTRAQNKRDRKRQRRLRTGA